MTSTGPLTGGVQLSGANDHACVRTNAGVAYCWGHDDNGTLGNDAVGDQSNVAVEVKGLSAKAARITIGGWHACALLTSGAVQCWGSGTAGELGNGVTADSQVPVPVTGLQGGATWGAAAGGPDLYDATCAIRLGKVSCWGNGQLGRLGDRGTSPRAVPAEVALPAPAIAVSGGFAHFCAVLADGAIVCWGGGGAGQLGDGTSIDRPVPVRAGF